MSASDLGAVHVHQADVVRSLIIVDDVGNFLAVVLKPCGFATEIGAGDGIDVAVAVDIAHLQAMRRGEVGVDVINSSEDSRTTTTPPVAAAGDDVSLPSPFTSAGMMLVAPVFAGRRCF